MIDPIRQWLRLPEGWTFWERFFLAAQSVLAVVIAALAWFLPATSLWSMFLGTSLGFVMGVCSSREWPVIAKTYRKRKSPDD